MTWLGGGGIFLTLEASTHTVLYSGSLSSAQATIRVTPHCEEAKAASFCSTFQQEWSCSLEIRTVPSLSSPQTCSLLTGPVALDHGNGARCDLVGAGCTLTFTPKAHTRSKAAAWCWPYCRRQFLTSSFFTTCEPKDWDTRNKGQPVSSLREIPVHRAQGCCKVPDYPGPRRAP